MEIDVIVEHSKFGTGIITEINYETQETMVCVRWDDGRYGCYTVDELEFSVVSPINPEERLRQALGIIKEFVTDIENHGLGITGEDWPELFITYQHAVEILS